MSKALYFSFALKPKMLRYKSFPSCIHLCGITVNVLYTFCVIDLFEWQLQRKKELLSSFRKELVVFKRIKVIFSNFSAVDFVKALLQCVHFILENSNVWFMNYNFSPHVHFFQSVLSIPTSIH